MISGYNSAMTLQVQKVDRARTSPTIKGRERTYRAKASLRVALCFCALAFLTLGAPARGQTFFAAGISGFAQSSPKPTGWYAVAVQLNKSSQTFSYTETDVLFAKTNHFAPVTTPQTGLLTSMKQIGPISLYALATAGAAVSTSATTAAYAGGGFFLVPLPTKKKISALFGLKILSSSTTGTMRVWYVGLEKTLQ